MRKLSHNDIKQRIGLCILLVFLVAGVFLFFQKRTPVKNSVGTVKQSILVFDIQKPRYETFQVAPKETALQLLQRTATITVSGEKENAFVQGISGRTARAEKREFWAFYINGKQSLVGAGSYYVQLGDTILWKIEKY